MKPKTDSSAEHEDIQEFTLEDMIPSTRKFYSYLMVIIPITILVFVIFAAILPFHQYSPIYNIEQSTFMCLLSSPPCFLSSSESTNTFSSMTLKNKTDQYI